MEAFVRQGLDNASREKLQHFEVSILGQSVADGPIFRFLSSMRFPSLVYGNPSFRTFYRFVLSGAFCFPPLSENPGRQDRVERQRAEDQRRLGPRNQGASFRLCARGLCIWMDQ